MIWTLILGAIFLLLLWELLKPHTAPKCGIYRQPGQWYLLKKCIFVLLFKWRQYKNNKSGGNTVKMLDENRGYGAGLADAAKLEELCPLDPDPYGIDAVFISGFNRDGVRLSLRIARRHNRCGELWLFLEIPGIGQLQHPIHPDTHVVNISETEFSAGGLKMEMVEYMQRWKVSYNGLLRHGLCNELEGKQEKYLHVKFSFQWTASTDPFSFDTDISAGCIADAVAREEWTKEFWDRLRSKHQTHYEQWGELRGRLQVEGYDEQFVRLKSIRDHSFGVRDWRSMYRYAIHFIYCEGGMIFQAGVVSLPDTTSHLKVGYLFYPSGQRWTLSDIDLKLWEVAGEQGPQNEYSFNFTTDKERFHVEVKGEITPIWYHHDDRGSKIYEKFCQCKVNGKKAYGLVEFHYRNMDGPAFTPAVLLPVVMEPQTESLQGHMSSLTLEFGDRACCSSKLVGGKGAQLGLLTSIQKEVGAVVPSGFCLTMSSFSLQLQRNPDLESAVNKIVNIIRDGKLQQLDSSCSDAVELFASRPICAELAEAVLMQMQKTFRKGYEDKLYAVRSSAMGEDGTEASSAGQMETYLGVKGLNEIIDSIRKCWASAFTYQAIQYRRQSGQPLRVSVGVVIQEMVKSEVSGVLFTCHPVTGSPSQMTIDASYGLGEAVVSGKTSPDNITVFRNWDNTLSVQDKHIGKKSLRMSVDATGGLKEKVEDADDSCCLGDDQILQLSNISVKVESYLGSPRDIEWAMADGKFYLLQARPITTLEQETDDDIIHEFDDPVISDQEWLTTGNIGEMMPGAVTPVTNSVFKSAVNRAVLTVCNLSSGIVMQKFPSDFLKYSHGHLFINMMLASVSGLNNISGAKEPAELALIGQSLDDMTVNDVREYYGILNTLGQRIWNVIAFASISKKKSKKCDEWYKRLKSYEVGKGQETSQELYKEINEKLPDYYDLWENTLVKSALSGAWGQAVTNIVAQKSKVYSAEHCADIAMLLSSCEDVYSAEVPVAVKELAHSIYKAGIQDQFLAASDEDCVLILQDKDHKQINEQYQTFLDRHGHRYVREAEFIERSWRAEPEKLMKVLKTILQSKAFEKTSTTFLSPSEAIAQMKTKLKWFPKLALHYILPKARKAVGQREFGKSISVELSDRFKEAYWKLADLMVKEGRLPEKELLFFLSHGEIDKLLKTRSPRLLTKAIRRRKLLPSLMKLKFPKLFQGRPKPIHEEDILQQRKSTFSLKGLPVCQGTHTGVARVVKSIGEANIIQKGDILIVSYTDIGWTPYFPLISGLVTEMGGLLSHGAVVAREYGLPCIVNVSNATQLFQSGDTVRLNCQAGTIERLAEEDGEI